MPQRLQSPRLPPVALPSLVPAADDDSETLSPTPYDTSPSLATARYSSFSSSESLSNGITLKRTCPSPSPECVILEDQEAEYARKPWKRPILESRKRQKKEWQGRGRSPFKTPVTTVIDSIKQDTRELVTLERELGAARAQLQSTMAQRLQELNTLHAQQQRLASPVNITELAPETTLLQPTARDSGSPTHSTSPSRQILLGFPKATPAVAINTLPEGHMSEEVAGVLREILQCCKQGYIPGGLRQRFQDADQWASLDDRAWDQKDQYTEMERDRIWGKVSKILEEARKCQAKSKDENSWSMEVVQRILRWGTGSGPPFTRLENIQSQAIDQDFLPVFLSGKVIHKKTDYALSFSDCHPDVQPVYESASHTAVGQQLSQMSDDYTGTLALLASAEVKRNGGSSVDAQAQLFMWLAAGITSLRRLRSCCRPGVYAQKRLPLVGWTVIGHVWEVYIAFERDEVTGAVQITGPIEGAGGDTRSVEGVFKLLNMVSVIKKYGKETYWPWLKADCLDAIV